jgi:hypothetical protein
VSQLSNGNNEEDNQQTNKNLNIDKDELMTEKIDGDEEIDFKDKETEELS